MKKLAVTLSIALLLAACSKPTETVIPADMTTWEKELAPSIQKLGDADKALFASYALRVKMSGLFGGEKAGIPFGTTVGQAIEDQKKWVAEQKKASDEAAALKVKMEAEKLETIKEINNSVTVTLLSKKERPENYEAGRYSKSQQFVVGVENKSTKDVTGVSGSIEFIDVFDKVVGSVNFGISEKIKPSGTYKWTGVRDYNQFIAEQRAVWNLEEGKYTTRFTPSAVIFADGTKLKMPD
jgi:hypothetical protein